MSLEQDIEEQIKNEVFVSMSGIEVRQSNDDEWGDILVIVSDETRFSEKHSESQLDEFVRERLDNISGMDLNKVIHKYPTFSEDTIAIDLSK